MGTEPHLVPRKRWPLGARLYWAVTAINQTSVEQIGAQVGAFTVIVTVATFEFAMPSVA